MIKELFGLLCNQKWPKSYPTYSNIGFSKVDTDSEMPFAVGGFYAAGLKPTWWPLVIPMAFTAVDIFHVGNSVLCESW